jgi:hypothetical protein
MPSSFGRGGRHPHPPGWRRARGSPSSSTRHLTVSCFGSPSFLSGMCRTIPYVDKRVEVRCSEGELGAWKTVAGDVPLSRWLRGLANKAVSSYPPQFTTSDLTGVDLSVPYEKRPGAMRPAPLVRPDFKGGKR